MKVINVNKKCAGCRMETPRCVKVSSGRTFYCLDSGEYDRYRKLWNCSRWVTVLLGVICVILLFV